MSRELQTFESSETDEHGGHMDVALRKGDNALTTVVAMARFGRHLDDDEEQQEDDSSAVIINNHDDEIVSESLRANVSSTTTSVINSSSIINDSSALEVEPKSSSSSPFRHTVICIGQSVFSVVVF